MTFDWNEYLLLAKLLSGESLNTEIVDAKLRTAISRIYYSVFNTTKLHLLKYCDIDLDFHTVNNCRKKYKLQSHEIVHKLLEVNDNEDIKTAGRHLFALKKKRVKADYDSNYAKFHVNPNKSDVADGFKYANSIVDALKLISNGNVEVKLKDLNKLKRN